MRRGIGYEVLKTAIAILFSLSIAILIILCTSNDALNALSCLVVGPLKNTRSFGNVIEMMIPFIFTGLAFCIIIQTKEINLGIDGSFFIGAVAAAVIGSQLQLPAVIHPVVAILAGGVLGGMICLIPGILKAKWNANEIVSSLMLNYIMIYLGIYIMKSVIRDYSANGVVSEKLSDTAMLSTIVTGTRIHSGLILAVTLIFICYMYLYKSKKGYEIRLTGHNRSFAKFSGINTTKVILSAEFLGGMIAGIGGATELLGMYTRFEWNSSPQYGWDGLIVATIAKYNPAVVPFAAFFLAYIRIGADKMSMYSDTPRDVVLIIQGVIIILVTAESIFLSKWQHKRLLKLTTTRSRLDEGNCQI